MSDANLLSLAIETYQRLLPELKQKTADNPIDATDQVLATNIPTVAELVELVQPLPGQSCLLGLCDDGAPFLFDLANRETGSLLLVGDAGAGKTHHLQTIVDSAVRLNAPHEVQIAVLTRDSDEWKALMKSPGYARYISGVYSWYEQGAINLIDQLVRLGENRNSGRHSGATVLLILDDLAGVFDASFETQNGLHWLLVDGPFSGIRPIASLDARLCPENPFWMDAFRTFLIGKVAASDSINSLGFSPEPETGSLVPGLEFCAFMGQQWMTYHVPTMDELNN